MQWACNFVLLASWVLYPLSNYFNKSCFYLIFCIFLQILSISAVMNTKPAILEQRSRIYYELKLKIYFQVLAIYPFLRWKLTADAFCESLNNLYFSGKMLNKFCKWKHEKKKTRLKTLLCKKTKSKLVIVTIGIMSAIMKANSKISLPWAIKLNCHFHGIVPFGWSNHPTSLFRNILQLSLHHYSYKPNQNFGQKS